VQHGSDSIRAVFAFPTRRVLREGGMHQIEGRRASEEWRVLGAGEQEAVKLASFGCRQRDWESIVFLL
jgi:hypothetical protein